MSAVLPSLHHIQTIQQWFGSASGSGRSAGEQAARAARRTDRNEAALASYVLAILSPLPLLGFLFGVTAFCLGLKGLRIAHRNPRAGGELQSWFGIAMGSVFSVLYLAGGVFLLTVLGH